MSNVTIQHEGGPTREEMAAVEKAGFGLGTMTVTIHEEHDARDQRDAAIEAAASTINVVRQSLETEKKLRKQLEEATASFRKERHEHTETRLAHAREVGELKGQIVALENEVASLRRLRKPKIR
jgi:chromosome segregation ATPase